MKHVFPLSFFLTIIVLIGCNGDDSTDEEPSSDRIQLTQLRVGTTSILNASEAIETDQPIVAVFSAPLDTSTVSLNVQLTLESGTLVSIGEIAYLDNFTTISFRPSKELTENTTFIVSLLDGIKGRDEQTFLGFEQSFLTINTPLKVTHIFIDDLDITNLQRPQNITRSPEIQLVFNTAVSSSDLAASISLFSDKQETFTSQFVNDSTVKLEINGLLPGLHRIRLSISSSLNIDDKLFDGFRFFFYTEPDSTPDFPEISDEELLTKIQEQTFGYFWDFGHPTSGLTRERNTSGDLVTIGGSGFGLMSILVGIERGFITRQEGVGRLEKIVDFLTNNAERYHGVWSHWLSGVTGETIPFSANDDGGDLVETSFLIQGLLTVRQYLDDSNAQEAELINTINTIWEEVEWDWHVQEGTNYLTWHWSPNFGFQKNLRISGWNESLIAYVLAAASPTFSIDKEVYDEGWARNGNMRNGNTFYNIQLPLGPTLGGPLFFSHYSFLGLDPRSLSDTYASNYFTQNEAHTLINMAYCIDNPGNYVGYSSSVWGLTASDNHLGYNAHSPTNDLGVITPTAAISSIPYTPEESLEAIRFFYYILGDKLWGEYGFYDAFNITEEWYADSYLAIDQGPIICMIENYRTGLLWDLFMSAPEVQAGLTKLGFTYE